jgi:hypothetical protein
VLLAAAGTATSVALAQRDRSAGRTLTEAGATDRLGGHLRGTADGVGVPFRLEERPRREEPCGDAPGVERAGRVRLRQEAGVRDAGIPNADVFNAFRAYWAGHGYEVVEDAAGQGRLTVRHPADGYRLTLTADAAGALSLSIESPCAVERQPR